MGKNGIKREETKRENKSLLQNMQVKGFMFYSVDSDK